MCQILINSRYCLLNHAKNPPLLLFILQPSAASGPQAQEDKEQTWGKTPEPWGGLSTLFKELKKYPTSQGKENRREGRLHQSVSIWGRN